MGDRSMMGQGMMGGGMIGSMARHMFCMRNGVPPVLSRPDQFAAGYARPNSRGRCALRPELRGLSRLDERLAKTAEEREALTADLDRRRVRRDFDLSRVGDEQQRINLALSRQPTNSVSCAPRKSRPIGQTNFERDGVADKSAGPFSHR